MITTWGIFWISFFGAVVLNTLIKRVLPPKYPKLAEDTYLKLRELSSLFASNINVNITQPQEKVSVRRANKEKLTTRN